MSYHSFFKSYMSSLGSITVSIVMLFAVSIMPAGFLFAEEGQSESNPVSESTLTVEQTKEQTIGDIQNGSSDETSSAVDSSGGEVEVSNSDTADDTSDSGDGGNGNEGAAPEGDALIETGDAVSQMNVTNTVNTNTVDTSASSTPAASSDSDNETTQNSEEEQAEVLGEEDGDQATTTTLSLDSENYATSTLTATSTAETGENSVETGEGTASVGTGDAFATANMINAVNSNFIGSNGSFQLLNLFGTIFGELSLSMENGAGCSFLCFLTELFVQNFNTAYLENNIAVEASTGFNRATASLSNASITTGDAFAAANVINMVNTNIIGADYLAFIMNAFGSWEGDLVLPPGSFFENLSNGDCCLFGNMMAENGNTADIDTIIQANADSGSNNTIGGEASTIEAGNADSVSNVLTIANTNIFGNNLLLMYVRTGGHWSGRIFSLPDGIQIVGTDDGFIIDGFSSRLRNSTLGNGGSTSIHNHSDARIINNVSASAFTGSNNVFAGREAGISTGNAFAAANVVNIANTNIIGKNWLLAILNIFGDWNGDLAFGRPDVWVGASAEGPSPLGNDAPVEFTVTYRNNGNAPATQSKISFNFGENFNVTDPNGGLIDAQARTITWDAGSINPGNSGSFTFAAQTHNTSMGDSQGVVIADADMYEDDADSSNNTDQLLLDFYNKPSEGFLGYSQIFARLEIKKERVGEGAVYPGDEVAYKITVDNKGSGNAYKVRVNDEMRNGTTVISTQGWDLDTVYPGEKVIIEYTVAFASSTPPGTYVNYALAMWYDENGNYVDHSGHSSASVEIAASENGNSNESEIPESEIPSDNEETAIATTTQSSVSDKMAESNFVTSSPSWEDKNAAEQISGQKSEAPEIADISSEIASDSQEENILEGAHVVYVKDARPLDNDLRNELERGRFNPWDPRNLFASISLSSIWYSVVWALLAAFVIYMVSRKQEA